MFLTPTGLTGPSNQARARFPAELLPPPLNADVRDLWRVWRSLSSEAEWKGELQGCCLQDLQQLRACCCLGAPAAAWGPLRPAAVAAALQLSQFQAFPFVVLSWFFLVPSSVAVLAPHLLSTSH